MISNSCSLSLVLTLPLSLMFPSSMSVCEKQRGSLSIYTNFILDNYLAGPTSLGESNNPSAPQLWGLPPQLKRRVNLNSIVGTIASTYNGGLTSMTLHDFIILMNLPIGTSRTNEIQYMKYTSEYISKLQIHQHSFQDKVVESSQKQEKFYWTLCPTK